MPSYRRSSVSSASSASLYSASEYSVASEASSANTSMEDLHAVLPLFNEQQYIMVTGGLGFIGSHTTLELLKSGYNVVIVDDMSNSYNTVFDRIMALAHRHYEAVGRPKACPQAELHNIKYQDSHAMTRLLGSYALDNNGSRIKGVIHFAAYKAVEESIKNPLKYYRNNVNGLVDFLGLLDDFNIKTFIFSSSATVYGTLADKGLPMREEHCVHETTTYQGHDSQGRRMEQGCTGLTNPYGRTKFFGEAILSDLAASDPSWTIVGLRYFNPIGCDSSGLLGESPKGTPSNLLPVVVKVMTGEWQELSVYGSDWNTIDGTAVRDYIHVTDLARGHLAALAATKWNPKVKNTFRTYNLGSGAGNSVKDVADTMEAVSKRPIPRKLVPRRAGDVGSCVAVADRAAEELRWRTELTLKHACEDICNYLNMNSF